MHHFVVKVSKISSPQAARCIDPPNQNPADVPELNRRDAVWAGTCWPRFLLCSSQGVRFSWWQIVQNAHSPETVADRRRLSSHRLLDATRRSMVASRLYRHQRCEFRLYIRWQWLNFVPASFCYFVGKTLGNVCYRDVAYILFIGKLMIMGTLS